ncbi:ribonuclease H-like domain-containing protein [Tanacetum coccineum]
MWLYKHKYNADGSLNRYKARLVANGRSQQQGIDYDETFSPVVKPATILTVLSLAVSQQWPIHQLDVKNAFFHGHLIKTVYMHQPPGFTDSAHSDYVCLLQKSLYGLKQAPRAWFQRFSSYIRAGFYHNKTDSSLFIFHKGPVTAYLLLYVDDIILTASSTSLLQRIISLLHAEFAMTDLGPFNYFLGISATRLQLTPRRSLDLNDHRLLHTLIVTGQDTLSRSSAEVEYSGVANAVAKTSWIRNLLRELHTPLFTATLVYYDNVSVYMSANPVQHQRTKHIEIDIHFVRDKVAAGHVRVLHVPSRFQYADIFTKGLPYPLFTDLRSNLSVRKSPAPTAGAYYSTYCIVSVISPLAQAHSLESSFVPYI